MQKSILDHILDTGEIHDNIKLSEEYKKYCDKGYEAYTKLMETLDEKDKTFLEKLTDSQMEQELQSNETYFKAGVKFGMRLAFECLND